MTTKVRQLLDEAEHDDNENFAVAFWIQMANFAALSHTKDKQSGSVPGKAGNIHRDYAGAHMHYMLKYFWPHGDPRPGTTQLGPEQPESAFERRFRMPRAIFNRVCATCVSCSPFLQRGMRPDATGRMGISPLLKVIVAIRMLAYALPADLADDMFDVSPITASLCLKEFCKAVDICFGTEYLREPSANDLIRIEREFAAVGFPGCIGCLDCAGWDWKNCPKALQGIMKGKDRTPTIRMEVICSLDLWIWSFQFGLPGAFNDLKILEISDHFNNVLAGKFPSVSPSYTIAGKVFEWFYYLTDGIYPAWKVFVRTLTDPHNEKTKTFCRRQEGVRKCVERVFGVLFRRFKMLFVASEFCTVQKMRTIARAAVILHNMTVELRRDNYQSDGSGGYSDLFSELEDETDMVIVSLHESSLTMGISEQSVDDDIKVKGLHRQLTKALIDHQWEQQGES